MDLKTLSAVVADYFEIDPQQLFQENRGKKHIAEARQSLIYLYKRLHPNKSQRQLGEEFQRDKSTIRYAIHKMAKSPPQKLIDLERKLVSTASSISSPEHVETT